MVWARSPHRRCRERPKSVSLRCPVGRDTAWGPMDGVSQWTGCPHKWGVPKPVPPDSYLSHPGGCSPSETRQALGWPLRVGGFRDPPTPSSGPPAPLPPTFTSLCMMPRSWRYTGEKTEPSEWWVPSRHGARCHPHGTRQAAAHPQEWLTLPAGLHQWGQWWLSPTRRATYPAPAPARLQTGGRWLRQSARRHATARAGLRCCSRCTLPGRAMCLTDGLPCGAGLARGARAPGWHGHGEPGGSLGPCTKAMQALGP